VWLLHARNATSVELSMCILSNVTILQGYIKVVQANKFVWFLLALFTDYVKLCLYSGLNEYNSVVRGIGNILIK
jgi:hypothetical protein